MSLRCPPRLYRFERMCQFQYRSRSLTGIAAQLRIFSDGMAERRDHLLEFTQVLGGFGTLRKTPCRSEEHTSELQSLMRISYAVFCLKKQNIQTRKYTQTYNKYKDPI